MHRSVIAFSRFLRVIAIVAAAGIGWTANAQPVIALPKITDINLYVQGNPGDLTSDLHGYGIELSFDVGLIYDDKYRLELALGYGQLFGLGSELGDGTLGTIRSLPSISVYLTQQQSGGGMSPYLGLHSGWLKLVGQGAGEDKVPYSITGETYELGVSVGTSLYSGLFVEVGYRIRSFPFLDYGTPNKAIPEGKDRAVRFNGLIITAGWQFDLTGTPSPSKPTEVKVVGPVDLRALPQGQSLPEVQVALKSTLAAVKSGGFTLMSVDYSGPDVAELKVAADAECKDSKPLLTIPSGVKLTVNHTIGKNHTLCASAAKADNTSKLTIEFQ
ncbi:MAG TPA: hypothetical protein VK539_26015 [Myxococcaceae bacterium]|nr:hypothetical protein [Myxococcaceae bacterium]